MKEYSEFLDRKFAYNGTPGIDVNIKSKHLFPHQELLIKWACMKGRAAVFADTGLGKTRIEAAWSYLIHKKANVDVLILAPLAVAEQTVKEGKRIGIPIHHAKDGSESTDGITITNYERLHRFDPDAFGAVVLDESSIIKHHDSKTLQILLNAFRETPYKLCATATPAPNDYMELGTHAEFLGICSRTEMLSEFFVHDQAKTQDWRLKGHAKKDFWRWVASWGAMIRSPSDLGFDGSMYKLPPMITHQVTVKHEELPPQGELFSLPASTLSQRRTARKNSLQERVTACALRVNESTSPWIVWCDLNKEGDELEKAIPDSVQVSGSDSVDHKEKSLEDFSNGKIRVLITKPKIAGFGLNWQHCHNIAFVGVTDSFESYYQAVRRCWRFGQTKTVNVYLFASDQEGDIRRNLERKEQNAEKMFSELSMETALAMKNEILGHREHITTDSGSQKINKPLFM